MKNILLLIHDDAGQEARYQVALDVARAVGGHITCLDLTVVAPFAADYMPLGGGGVLVEAVRAEAANPAARMRSRIEHEDVPFDWISKIGFLEQAIEDRTALIDLVVLSSDADGEVPASMTDAIGEILVRTGKPVLAVPAGCERLDPLGSAMVAWDGSGDAEAALSAAIPLLVQAQSVTLFEVGDRSMPIPVEDAARYLSRHGITPVVRNVPSGPERIGRTLLSEVERTRPAYVVMGGFGHSRTLESLFGGVTQTMLKHCRRPMLLVHRR